MSRLNPNLPRKVATTHYIRKEGRKQSISFGSACVLNSLTVTDLPQQSQHSWSFSTFIRLTGMYS
ncbi:hypothetical protein M407DRAFT_104312 [Tulasnella calospora MUT 4182]|uniref:Uncharacterized protein n=1 Tax=Tulasnella calospora MUT 4182 TaxID=1051891 RepID=A0A0C3LRJ3_9AGAM|nr:hypothetical protein M407DRAFT_104312 [Tulasnella calospora MUT 4182]